MLDTIVALATPPLKSALAIIRISGEKSFEIVSSIFSKEIKCERNKIFHGFLKDEEETLDEVILLAYKGPFSYTSEDSVEIICHGSPVIFNQIIQVLIKKGCRLATGGEFTSRAYLNKKMDLIQAESINDLINAESIEAKNITLMSLEGKTSSLITPLKEDLAYLLSLIEVNIDYPEYEDIEEVSYQKIKEIMEKSISYISKLIKDGEKGNIIRDGINVAIVGKPNVGKSSILNALINKDKAIISDIKGTTRDIVEGSFLLNGIMVNLFDTAGIRESNDKIEEIGINKSIEAIDEADLILAVFDDSKMDEEDQKILELIKNKKHLIVQNKIDKLKEIYQDSNVIYVSALNKEVEALKKAIFDELGLSNENYHNPSISNSRELGILSNVLEIMKKIEKDVEEEVTLDLISSDIKTCYLQLLSLTGEDNDFDVAKEIFSRFCVGK